MGKPRGAELLGVWKEAMKSSSISVNPELTCTARREPQDPFLRGGVAEATIPPVLVAQGFRIPNFNSVPQYLLPHPKASKGIQAAAAMASAKFALSSGSSQTKENMKTRMSRVPSLPPSMMNSSTRDHYMMDVEFNNLSMTQSSSKKEMPADLEAIEAWIDADFGKLSAEGGYMLEADGDSYEKMLKQLEIEDDSDSSSVLYNVYQYPTFEPSLEVYNYDTISYVEDLWTFS